jgi:Transposase IS4
MNRHVKLVAVQYGKFLQWLGLWLLTATIQGTAQHEFWKKEPIDLFYDARIRNNKYMSKNRFQVILSSLQFTDKEPPDYIDKFCLIRDLVNAWNDNLHNNFNPGWANGLDKSMMVWTNQWTFFQGLCLFHANLIPSKSNGTASTVIYQE